MDERMRKRIAQAKNVDRFMTILFSAIGGFFLIFILLLAGYIIVNGLMSYFPGVFSFSSKGIGNQLFNTIYLLFLSLLFSCLVGIPAGIYMAEYAKQGKVTEFLRMSIESLSSLPSIVIGLFGYLAFVLTFGATWNLLAGSLTVSILSIPLITTSTEDAIRALPRNFVEGSMALGSTHWYAIVHTLLPAALPRIGSGIILAAGRVFGEATALMYTSGMSTRIDWANWDLTSPLNALNPLRTGETLALHIWVMRSEAVDPNSAKIANFSAAILVIVVLLFSVIARRIVSNINKKQTGSAKK
ncbi:PstA family ABC transporter permease [Levyella massiliensis]|uniref:PstA family ABC transporter permease n=1 Tax=Levyella massiliensis TaxID=938289 RepID=UPI00036A5B24|nr:PstA family ABC transporter permease [Levyella massiliensis]